MPRFHSFETTTKRKPLPVVEDKEYDVSWFNQRGGVVRCTFKRVTEKGYNFIKSDGTKYLKRNVYRSKQDPSLFFFNKMLHVDKLVWPKKIQKDPVDVTGSSI